jgi:hypothetical protein
MLNVRLSAARRIAEALIPSEADIDAAIASTSRLIAAIAEGRDKTKLPVSMGQESLNALTITMSSLIAARSSIAEAHAALAQDRIDAGLRTYGMGDVSDCPPTAGLTLVERTHAAA